MKWLRVLMGLQLQVWAIEDNLNYWHKVVAYRRPYTEYPWKIVGPFRSEIDAEEFCDRINCEDLPMYSKCHHQNR